MSENLSYLAKKSGLKQTIGEKIDNNTLIGKASTTAAKSFYDFLTPESKNYKVRVCNGTACQISKKQDAVKFELLKKYDSKEIGIVNCLGHCYDNTAFMSGEDVIQSKNDLLHAESLCDSPVLLAPTPSISDLKKQVRETLLKPADVILCEVEKSKLRGRGGAGFPMALKLKACKEAKAETKYVICNADEGDPGSYSDKYLLESRPELVLYGLLASAKIVGAKTAILYIRAEYPKAYSIINKTIEIWKDNNLLGEDIQGTGFDLNIVSVKGAGSYICGEETALLSSIEGQRAEVRVRPPYPAISGLFNLPTTISNVETLANLYTIIGDGGDNYSTLGTGQSTGVKLISVNSIFIRPGVYEVEMGTSLGETIKTLGLKHKTKALQIGGPLGGVIPIENIDQLSIDFESFKNQNFLLGHAGIVAIPETFPMIKFMEHLLQFTSEESCGKCVPCRIGATRGLELIKNSGESKIDKQLFSDLLETMADGSCCALGGGISLPIRNIIEHFSDELQNFFEVKL